MIVFLISHFYLWLSCATFRLSFNLLISRRTIRTIRKVLQTLYGLTDQDKLLYGECATDHEPERTENFWRVCQSHVFHGRVHSVTLTDNSHRRPSLSPWLQKTCSHGAQWGKCGARKPKMWIIRIKSCAKSVFLWPDIPRTLNKIRQGYLALCAVSRDVWRH